MSGIMVTKITLSSGKVVLLREMKIKHTELAAQEVAPRANGDANVLSLLMQKALVKQLIVQIDDKRVSQNDLEDMDALFSMSEYSQVISVVKKLAGGDDMGKEPITEVVTFGDK